MKSLPEYSRSRPWLRIAFHAVAKAIDRLFTKPWFGRRLVVPLQTMHEPAQNEVLAPIAPIAEQDAFVAQLPTVQRTEFPPTLLFEPDATAPSVGSMALTGRPLPGGAVGLVIQLNSDSARHFTGDPGIANISIPMETLSTFRFGIYGVRARPRCEFELRLRYVGQDTIGAGVHRTSVMGYGFASGETGRRDVRLHVPLAVRNLGQAVRDAGLVAPAVGDLALLEWPTPQDPAFGLTFLDTQSSICRQALKAFGGAIRAGDVLGGGACWLASGISPQW